MNQIPESDWKVFSPLYKIALDRLCQRILAEVETIVADESKTMHARYLAIYKHIQDRDDDIDMTFGGFSRSKAPTQLVSMRSHGLVTDSEFLHFSEETRSFVDSWINFSKDRG